MRISDWSSDVCSSDLAGRLSLPEQVKRLAEHRRRGLCLLVALLALFEEVRDALPKAVEIGEHQFGLYRLGIGDGIDAALDMVHLAIQIGRASCRERVGQYV